MKGCDDMGHTPFGYKIKNGRAVIDEDAAVKIRLLYDNYLSGMSLVKAAQKAGIETYHGTARRILQNPHYPGDDFYPALIDRATYEKAAAEINRRSTVLGRNHRKKETVLPVIPTTFHLAAADEQHEDPKLQAEYLYSLIESEVD
jgi:hypothetical protein